MKTEKGDMSAEKDLSTGKVAVGPELTPREYGQLVKGEAEFSTGKEDMHHHAEVSPETVKSIQETWTAVRENPSLYIEEEKFAETIFMAGGGLVELFGKEGSEVWKLMEQKLSAEGKLNIAGIDFTEQQFQLIGDFNRWLMKKGYSTAQVCIDERADLRPFSQQSEIPHTHKGCGALAGLAGALNLDYDKLVGMVKSERGDAQDQDVCLLPKMEEEHTSLEIYVNTSTKGRAIKDDQREALRDKKASPFHVSIPVELVQQFCKEEGQTQTELFQALVNWNAQIARNIIGGHHNELHELAGETQIQVDNRGVAEVPAELVDMLQKVGKVQMFA